MTDQYQHDNDGSDHFADCRPLEKDAATKAKEPTDTEIKVWEMIGLYLGDYYTPERFSNSANIKEDLQADILDRLGIVMEAEDQFGIEIDDVSQFETVQDLVNIIESKL